MTERSFKRLLIADSGLGAKRAIQTAHSLGIEAGVALYSDDSPSWADTADFVVHPPMSGEGAAAQSFGVVGAAIHSGCDAIFPSWAEERHPYALSALSAASHIAFVGGDPEHFSTVNNRVGVRWAASDLKMDVVPTSDKITKMEDAEYWLARMGVPVVMRTLRHPSVRLFDEDEARRILENALLEGPLVLEKFVRDAREIETVMFAQGDKLPICLGEGEISQKINGLRSFAEFPPLGLTEDRLHRIRVQAAQLIVGTRWRGIIAARFLLTPDGRAYFLQLTPGLRPWHIAVEYSIGVDLYDAQIRVSMGEDLGWEQKDICYSGHTISMMVHAKEAGRISKLHLPEEEGLRWGPMVGDRVQAGEFIGTLSVYGRSRQASIVRAKVVLDELGVGGVSSNLSELRLLFESEDFWRAPPSRDNQR